MIPELVNLKGVGTVVASCLEMLVGVGGANPIDIKLVGLEGADKTGGDGNGKDSSETEGEECSETEGGDGSEAENGMDFPKVALTVATLVAFLSATLSISRAGMEVESEEDGSMLPAVSASTSASTR